MEYYLLRMFQLWVSPSVTGPTSTSSVFLRGARGHTHPPKNTYFHIDTCTHVCRQLQKCTRNIWGYFQIQCMNLCLTLYLISLGKHSLSLNVKKKKKGNTIRSYFFQRGREVPHESHLVAGDITEIWQEFSGSFLPFLSSGYWSPILGSYLHSGPSPMCNIISSFWEASFWHLNLLFPGG